MVSGLLVTVSWKMPFGAEGASNMNPGIRPLWLAAERPMWPEVEALSPTLVSPNDWLISPGLIPLHRLEEVRAYRTQLAQRQQSELLFVRTDGWSQVSTECPASFAFCGYDYGTYSGAWDHFSAISNDVSGGKYSRLQKYEKELNRFSLCGSVELVLEIHRERERLIEEGASLEHYAPFTPVPIFREDT